MANEFIARNGIYALCSSQVTGSLSVTSDINGDTRLKIGASHTLTGTNDQAQSLL